KASESNDETKCEYDEKESEHENLSSVNLNTHSTRAITCLATFSENTLACSYRCSQSQVYHYISSFINMCQGSLLKVLSGWHPPIQPQLVTERRFSDIIMQARIYNYQSNSEDTATCTSTMSYGGPRAARL